MTIYADMVFLLNGCIDFLLLWLTSGIRKQRVSIQRLLVAGGIGGLYATLHLWSSLSFFYTLPIKVCVSLLMVWIAFRFQHWLAYLRNVGVFYLVCFITGGAIIALHYVMLGNGWVAGGILFTENNGWGSPVSWGMIILGFPFVWIYTHFSFRSLQERREIHQFLTKIRIHIDGKPFECTGLVDTGNQLRDPISRAPVVLVEMSQIAPLLPEPVIEMIQTKDWEQGWSQIPPEWMVKIRLVPFRAAASDSEMLITCKPDQVEIWQKEEWNNTGKVLIGIDVGQISSDGSYQAIIHPSCVTVAS